MQLSFVHNSLISKVLIRFVHKYCDHQGTYSQKRLNSYPKTSFTDPRSNRLCRSTTPSYVGCWIWDQWSTPNI